MRSTDKNWSICVMQACLICQQHKPTVDGMCISCTDNKCIDQLEDENKKLKLMIDEGLGWEDMQRDINSQ